MSNIPLTLGSALLAFGPYISIFFLIVYKKAQLVIVATSAAFFFLLASTGASLVWLLFHTIGLDSPFSAIVPGVFFQFVARCAFVSLYHKVETVIQQSIAKQQEEEQKEYEQNQNNDPNNNATSTNATNVGVIADGQSRINRSRSWADAARLRLELNDAISAIAAATGYGGMHAILLFGTLLAGQTANVGVLYQDSCPRIPSLVVSACFTFLFSILDVFLMLFTFFGMRRRLLFHRGDAPADVRLLGGYLGNSRNGGNVALLVSLVTHFMASVVTVADYVPQGCRFSIPAVGGIVLLTMYIFWAGCGRIYMPPISSSSSMRRGTSNIIPSLIPRISNDEYHEC